MASENHREKSLKVIKDVSEAQTLTTAFKNHHINAQDFFSTIKEVPLLGQKYADAQAARAEIMVDEIIEIADTETDSMRARNRIDVRKWAASKMKPDKFGDRIDVNINTTVDIRGALEEAKSRIRNVIEISQTQAIESSTGNPLHASGLQPVEIGSTENFDLDDLLK